MEFEGVARLDTKTMGGRAMTWLPVDETEAGTLEVELNGEYLAESEGLYGYSEVTVNVPIQDRDRCVFGYERDAKVAVMACMRDGRMMGRMFPSYIKIEPYSQSMARTRRGDLPYSPYTVRLMTARDTVYRSFTTINETALGWLNDVHENIEMLQDELATMAICEEFDIVYAVDGTETGLGSQAVEEMRGKYMSVTDNNGNGIYGRAGYLLIHPTMFAAKPTWLNAFSTFMDAAFNERDYVIFGREVDGDVKVPEYLTDGMKLCYMFYVEGEEGFHLVPVENVSGDIF